MYDVAIIGCGIVGAAAAYELSKLKADIVIIEKENDVACGTTRANSAIIHAGYDPKFGTKMASTNVRGCKLAEKLCGELGVPFRRIGSLVLAFSEEDMEHVRRLYDNGVKNGVKGMELWDSATLHEREKNVSPEAIGALYAPSAGIVNPWEYCLALAETAVLNGARLMRSAEVTSIKRTGGAYTVCTTAGDVEARFVINAAGVYAGRIHSMVSEKPLEITPLKGEYYLLDKSEYGVVKHVIFQCPTKDGKGVLVAPTVDGNVIVGPNSVKAEPDDTSVSASSLSMIREAALRSVPNLKVSASIRNFAGLRASAEQDDFIIEEAEDAPGFIDLAGIKSPGLTSAPAIAEEAVKLLKACGLKADERESFTHRPKRIRFKELDEDEKRRLVEENPEYGRVICRCETITEGEILYSLHETIPALSVDGVKRRTGAGLGRCQGGFCAPRVVELMERELGLSTENILQDRAGTNIFVGETKGC